MAELSGSEEAEDAENGELIKFNITFLEPHQDHQQHKKRKKSNPIRIIIISWEGDSTHKYWDCFTNEVIGPFTEFPFLFSDYPSDRYVHYYRPGDPLSVTGFPPSPQVNLNPRKSPSVADPFHYIRQLFFYSMYRPQLANISF